MSKSAQGKGQYDEVVGKLESIVEALEGGELSLEESLERFAQGIHLVRQGESLLSDAEKRIEQLLSDEGRTAPIDVKELPLAPAATVRPAGSPAAPKRATPPADDDVPF